MTLPAATRATVEALVRARRSRADGDPWPLRVIGVRARPEWDGPATFLVDGEPVRVAPCRSTLEVRGELVDHDDPNAWLVLLTDREERDLGQDVLVRLARRRLHAIDHWHAVAEAFGARAVDAALRLMPDLADALLDHRPPGGYAPVGGTVLDRDTAWTAFAERVLGLGGMEHDPAVAALEWLASGRSAVALAAVPDSVLESWWSWLADRIGAVARFAQALVGSGRSDDTIALGLCGRLLIGEGDAQTARVHGRFDQIVGARLDDSALATVVEVAERAATDRDLGRGTTLLTELVALGIAGRSDLLPLGFTARLAGAGAALSAAMSDPAMVGAVDAALRRCRAHREAAAHEPRLDAIAMALRLARRLALGDSGAPASFAEAAVRFAADSAWVDHARSRVWRGESEAALVQAYRRLQERLLDLREAENERFAGLLGDWLQSGSSDPRIVGVEDVLHRVVAGIVQQAPVLLIVMDGLGWPSWAELSRDLPAYGWDELVEEVTGGRLVGVATVPSVTTYSRASLLSGELRGGTAHDETARFAAVLGRRPADPVAFHRADLVPAGGGSIAPAVSTAIGDQRRQLVGVVINEVDDSLAGGLQADRRVRIAEMGPLVAVLDAARGAGRICVLTSDHGHVVEHEVAYRASGSRAERWRPSGDGVAAGEIALSGRRVLAGGGAVIAPWTERVRYRSARSAGYHGGATPQEMLVPVAVLAPRGAQLDGWRPAAPAAPAWWDEDVPLAAPVSTRSAASLTSSGPPPVEPAWIERLLASPLYATQRGRHARVALDDERARRALAFLAARGGRATIAALAAALDLPEHRARGAIAGLRRVLAVDGFDVLEVVGEDLTLDRSLLQQQFGLTEAPAP